MTNAYITMEGVVRVNLTPEVHALGAGITDEHALRKLFLDQQAFYSGQKTPGEIVGVINGKSAKVTLFDDGTAKAFIWGSRQNLTVKWTRE